MRSPDLVEPDRLDELLAGATPEREREAELQRLVRELRTGLPPAPLSVRDRVRELNATPPPTARRPRPAVVALAGIAAVAAGLGATFLLDDSPDPREAAPREAAPTTRPAAGSGPSPTRPAAGSGPVQPVSGESDSGGAALVEPSAESVAAPPSSAPPIQPLPDTSRARDVDMSLELRVRDADEVSEAATEAMGAARDLGGYVVSSDVDTRGDAGRARLSLRVPVARLDDAVVRLSSLGTIMAQDVEIADLQGAIDARTRRIQSLRRAIRIDELRLASDALTEEERLRIEIRLERARHRVADLERARARLAREAAMAEVTLTLHTREARAGGPDESRIGAAARRALDVVAGAGAVAVFVLIAGAPLVALVVLAWLLARSRTRRRDARLLEQPRPVAPPPPPPA